MVEGGGVTRGGSAGGAAEASASHLRAKPHDFQRPMINSEARGQYFILTLIKY